MRNRVASIARTQRTRGRARGLRLCGLALPPSSRLFVGQVQEASQTQHPWLSAACCLSSKTKVMGPRLNFPLLHLLISPPLPSSPGLPDQGTNSYQLPGQHLPRCRGASPLPTQVPHTFLHIHRGVPQLRYQPLVYTECKISDCCVPGSGQCPASCSLPTRNSKYTHCAENEM